jgi:hypothetical protein
VSTKALAAVLLWLAFTACRSPMDELDVLDPVQAEEIRVTCARMDYPVESDSIRFDSREDCEKTFATMARTETALRTLAQHMRQVAGQG